jgi:hypothetical protein
MSPFGPEEPTSFDQRRAVEPTGVRLGPKARPGSSAATRRPACDA